jgi:flagellar biosynthesis protein FlhF
MLELSAAKFATAGTTAMILTKLDESSGMGALLSVARRIDLPISYLTAGQAVPDDIEPAHPRRIARLILGQERVVK